MKEIILKHKFIIIAIALLSTLLIGGTYAWTNIEIIGEKTNKIISGSLELTLNEESCTEINLQNASPISDNQGMETIACTFTLSNTGSHDSKYTLSLNDLEIEASQTRMDDKFIKYSLIKNNENTIKLLSTSRNLDTGTLKIGESITYELRLWIDYDATNEAMNKVLKTNLKLTANSDIPKPVIENITDYYTYGDTPETDLDGSLIIPAQTNHVSLTEEFKNAIFNNLPFTDSIGNIWNPGDPLPNPGRTYTINSETKNVESMTVMFFDENYIMASDPTIYPKYTLDLSLWDTANVTNMKLMFGASAAETLNLSSFDTANVTNMSYMFGNSVATTLDLSNFDTRKVTDMSSMFYNNAATVLDLNYFDTSNVTNMSGMFTASAATTLDLSNFDTSKVIDMSDMFAFSAATTLDLSYFDTSNVTNMSGMFAISAATTLDLSDFDTSNVTDMGSMFYKTVATTLDVSGFDTSNVTDMNYMFSGSAANPIYVKDQNMLDKFINEGNATSDRLQIKQP